MKSFPKFSFLLSVVLGFGALAHESRDISKTVPLNAKGRLVIDTYKGGITVETWDKAEVEVHARIEADDSWSSRGDEEVVQQSRIESDFRRHNFLKLQPAVLYDRQEIL